jgi:hypothetical protein
MSRYPASQTLAQVLRFLLWTPRERKVKKKLNNHDTMENISTYILKTVNAAKLANNNKPEKTPGSVITNIKREHKGKCQ